MSHANKRPEQLDLLDCNAGKGVEVAAADYKETYWLGLTTGHRRLFDALQDGWLRQLPSSAGQLLGVGAFPTAQDTSRARHAIRVRIKLDVSMLPEWEISLFRGDQWISSSLDATGPTDTVLYWPGAIPTFAISRLAVETEEERARLMGLAKSVSNVELPDVSVTAGVKTDRGIAPLAPPVATTARLDVPSEMDALHGAMSMAMWSVPRIDPWLEVLVESLSARHEQLRERAADLKAGWWQFPPWLPPPGDLPPLDLHNALWLAAVSAFKDHSSSPVPPGGLAEEIAAGSLRFGPQEDAVSEWLQATQSILRAESTIEPDRCRACPVGVAIQLVLTRPEPMRFKSWFKEMPTMPPAVAWSAAVLCGLYHGYRKLDTRFRGKAKEECAFTAVHALRACASNEIRWPFLAGEPNWRREEGGFVLRQGNIKIAHMSARERGHWYVANFDDAKTKGDAERVAKDLGWPCQTLKLEKSSRVPYSGKMENRDGELVTQGPVAIQLPPGYTIEFDIKSFRHQIAVGAGELPGPPKPKAYAVVAKRLNVHEVPGLTDIRDFLSETEETYLVKQINQCKWNTELSRRVQHYGWQYDYKARQVDPAMRLGSLPPWADSLARRLFAEGFLQHLPDQVIVNEYVGKQGISPHTDSGSFADGIAMLSLLESWGMVFRQSGSNRRFEHKLERRSVAVMEGEARYNWTHEIPKRKTEPSLPKSAAGKSNRVTRRRRLSLTFRKVIVKSSPDQPSRKLNPRGRTVRS